MSIQVRIQTLWKARVKLPLLLREMLQENPQGGSTASVFQLTRHSEGKPTKKQSTWKQSIAKLSLLLSKFVPNGRTNALLINPTAFLWAWKFPALKVTVTSGILKQTLKNRLLLFLLSRHEENGFYRLCTRSRHMYPI